MAVLSRPTSTINDLLPEQVPIRLPKVSHVGPNQITIQPTTLWPRNDIQTYLHMFLAAAKRRVKLEATKNPTAVPIPLAIRHFVAIYNKDFLDQINWFGACRSPPGTCTYSCWDRMDELMGRCLEWMANVGTEQAISENRLVLTQTLTESPGEPRAKYFMRLSFLAILCALDILFHEFTREGLKETLLDTLDLFTFAGDFPALRRHIQGLDNGPSGGDAAEQVFEELTVVLQNVSL